MSSTSVPVVAVVPVVSAWYSKINWIQVVSGAGMLMTFTTGGQVNMTASQQAAVVVVIGLISNIATFVMRTWFNGTVNPASLPK